MVEPARSRTDGPASISTRERGLVEEASRCRRNYQLFTGNAEGCCRGDSLLLEAVIELNAQSPRTHPRIPVGDGRSYKWASNNSAALIIHIVSK